MRGVCGICVCMEAESSNTYPSSKVVLYQGKQRDCSSQGPKGPHKRKDITFWFKEDARNHAW